MRATPAPPKPTHTPPCDDDAIAVTGEVCTALPAGGVHFWKSRAVESDEPFRRSKPEVAVQVLGDRQHVAGLLVGPRGKGIAEWRGGFVGGRGGRRRADRERQPHDQGQESERCGHVITLGAPLQRRPKILSIHLKRVARQLVARSW